MSRDFTREDIERQAEAARLLIAEMAGDDEEFAHDIAEGETMLFEAIEVALAEMDECDILANGLAAKIDDFKGRKSRIDERRGRLVGMIDQAFQIAGIQKHQFASATISVKRIPPKLIVLDEAAIPADFWDPQPPKLNRQRALSALKESTCVPGAEMSNGGQTIQIRRV